MVELGGAVDAGAGPRAVNRYKAGKRPRTSGLGLSIAKSRALEVAKWKARRPPAAPPAVDASRLAREEAATRLAEAERVARDARVREEERRALLARVARVPAADRARFLEEERLVARGREMAARLRREGGGESAVDLSVFGIDLVKG